MSKAELRENIGSIGAKATFESILLSLKAKKFIEVDDADNVAIA